jgi:predicted nucleic acid-binding protein
VSRERVLLDSVILIDHFNGVEVATTYLQEVSERAYISAITRAEVQTGFDEEDLPLARSLLDTFPLLVIDGKVADLAAILRRTNPWRLPDALQVAVARHHGLVLATRNTSDFPPEKHDFVRMPYTIPRRPRRRR